MYTSQKIKTAVELVTAEKLPDILTKLTLHMALVGYYNKMELLEAAQISEIDLDAVLRLRVFLPAAPGEPGEELFVWRSNGKLKARLRRDSNEGNDENTVVDSTMFLEKKLISEKQGKSFSRISIRNYARLNEMNQLYYFDSRLICLT